MVTFGDYLVELSKTEPKTISPADAQEFKEAEDEWIAWAPIITFVVAAVAVMNTLWSLGRGAKKERAKK